MPSPDNIYSSKRLSLNTLRQVLLRTQQGLLYVVAIDDSVERLNRLPKDTPWRRSAQALAVCWCDCGQRVIVTIDSVNGELTTNQCGCLGSTPSGAVRWRGPPPKPKSDSQTHAEEE